MNTPGENDIWTPPRLRARLAAQRGLAPAPSCYVVWRATGRPGGQETRGYELPGQPGRRNEAAFEQWLIERNLAGADRLSVSVLVIREQLDADGNIREAVLERRRGGVDGPYYGNVARVEFAGAAKLVRRYRASREGRLSELPLDDETDDPRAAGVLETARPRSDLETARSRSEPEISRSRSDLDPEGFAGEDAAVHAYLGPGALILDRRPPSLFEDIAGLSTIVHARRADGAEVGCGVGWHGGTAFVLAADFPRHARPLAPPAELEAAVTRAVKTRHLIRYETRLDDLGFCVIARERGRQNLVTIRLEGKGTRIDPYVPGPGAAVNDDQRRWMTYTETYEARTVLDSWKTGNGDEVAVLTIDPDQEAWRHVIDEDGVEVSCFPDNEAAAAVLYRERVNPPDDPPARDAPPAADTAAAPPPAPPASDPATETGHLVPSWIATDDPGQDTAPDSLLRKLLAWSRAAGLLTDALSRAASGDPGTARDRLHALEDPLIALDAVFSANSLRRLLDRAEAEAMAPDELNAALREFAARLRDEVAMTRIVTVAGSGRAVDDAAPFGPLVALRVPEIAYDAAEAVRCLALRRPTAAVLHAMQIMRFDLAIVRRLFATQDLTLLTWEDAIPAVRAAAGDDRRVAVALTRVRRAWRSPGLLPAGKYTEEEAEAVLAAVESFTRLLAARLDAAEA